MRNTNIISSIANGFIRFDAANEVLRGFTQRYLCLQPTCAGSPAGLAFAAQGLPTGSSGAANQGRLRNRNMDWPTRITRGMGVTMTFLTAVAESGLKPKHEVRTSLDSRLERTGDCLRQR